MKIFKTIIALILVVICFITGCSEGDIVNTKTAESKQQIAQSIVQSDAEPENKKSTQSQPDKIADSCASAKDTQILSYVANKKSGKLHYPDCASVRQMNEENKLHLRCTRDEALSKGYEPCMRCEP